MLTRLLWVSLAAALALPAAAQDESFGDQIRRLLDEGTRLYKQGKFDEAASKFEEAFQLKPSSDQVYAHLKRAGEDLVEVAVVPGADDRVQDRRVEPALARTRRKTSAKPKPAAPKAWSTFVRCACAHWRESPRNRACRGSFSASWPGWRWAKSRLWCSKFELQVS